MYQQQQQRRLEGVAGLLAKQGRYGDSMLVHMNPIEVEGLASMSPTGSLTVNPETGQPEAFLPFLLPLLGGLGGSALAAGSTGLLAGKAALAGAIGSGLGSFAATGDLKQGLISGITGFGIGSALSGAANLAKDAAIEGAAKGLSAEAIAKTGADAFTETGITSAFSKPGLEALMSPTAVIGAGIGEGTNMQIRAEEAMKNFDKAGERMSEAELARQGEAIVANQFNPNLTPAPYDPGGTDYGAQYANAGGIVSLDPSDFRKRFNGLMEMGAPIVGMLGGGTFPGGNFGNMAGVGGYGNAIPAQQQAALRDPYIISPGQLQDVYAQQGMPGFGPEIMYFTPEKGVNPNPFKDWVPDPIAAPSEGGGEGDGTTGSETAGVNTTDEFIEIDLSGIGGGRTRIPNPSYIPPEGESAAETTTETTSTPAAGSGLSAEDYADLYSKYMNYGGNFSPFKEGGKIQERPPSNPIKEGIGVWIKRQLEKEKEEERRQKEPFTFEKWKARAAREVEDLFEDDEQKEEALKAAIMEGITFSGHDFSDSMAEGGETQVNADADRLIDLAAMAVLGELPEEEASVVVQAFIDEFGEEAFSTLRESVLEGIVPGSQKEGEIVGPGGGMDDQIMGMIGNQQPVAVSPGEYIVPADVVSGIGDGSTDAGVQQLDGMLDRVRVERTNTTQQPRPLRKGGVLPR